MQENIDQQKGKRTISFTTRFAAYMLGLPPAVSHKLEYLIDLPVSMADSAVLLANRVVPVGGKVFPIILIRKPIHASRQKTG